MLASIKCQTKNINWVDYLHDIQYTVNTTVSNTIRKSPYEVVFRKEPNTAHNLGHNIGQILNESKIDDELIDIGNE